MTHRRAARLLAALLDGALTPALRREVRSHTRACAACRRRLREDEAIEALVRLLPSSLLPLDPSPAAQVRLWSLAQWFVDPVAQARERFRISAVGAFAFGLAAAFFLMVWGWGASGGGIGGLLVMAQAAPDAATTLPLGWR
ncbi:zf-HC2 domain-containing protein [Myxococcota bacterium]|nr:zf-HC2 domain-containing protein [Myxococcota bacterium]